MNTLYVLYDQRYYTDEERATIYCIEETLEDALKMQRKNFPDAVIVRCHESRGIIVTDSIVTKEDS